MFLSHITYDTGSGIVIIEPGSWQLNTRQPLAHPFPFTPPQQYEEEKWTKGKTHEMRQRLFSKTAKEILVLIIVMITMNMQNKLYTIEFFYSQPNN